MTLVLAVALAALRSEFLPTWLGWAGAALFVLAFTPAAFFAVMLSALWILVVSVLLYRRSGKGYGWLAGGDASRAASPVA